ncbi:hypothetical protein KY334_03240 [Candidatus Woesearchaeota archaeon]|nr:hypothetical protein [Candidatus Woesearchaeota archaeon]
MTSTKSTIFISDTHGDLDFFKAIGNLTHSIDGTVLLNGDIGSDYSLGPLMNVEAKADEIRKKYETGEIDEEAANKEISKLDEGIKKVVEADEKEVSQIDKIFETYKNQVIYGLGNHDREGLVDFKNAKRISNEVIEVNGYKIGHIDHYSASFYNPDIQNHSEIKKQQKDGKLEEMLSNIDILMSHEIPSKKYGFIDERKKQTESETVSEELVELVNKYKLSLFGGHVHEPIFDQEEDGRFYMRTCCGRSKNKAFYVTDHTDNTVYEIKYENLMKWNELQNSN